jgi:hypothetical protein
MAFSHNLFIWVPRFAGLRLRFALDDANFSIGFKAIFLIALDLWIKV